MIKKRYAAFLPVAAAAAMLASGPTSAGAAVGGGAGTVAGAVNITTAGGIPLQGNNALAFTFTSTAITGAVVCSNGSNATFAGTINVTASGSGVGNQVTDGGSVSGTINGSGAGGSIGGTISGTYTRVGSNTLVQLTGNATVSGPTGTCSGPLSATVVAEFIPDAFAPGTTNPSHAQFVGIYADASVA